MNYNISPVEESDFVELVEVWEASVRATHHFLNEEHIQFFKPLILNEYLKMVELACIKNANKKILGFSGVLNGKIEMLFLHPESRDKGIGKVLLSHALQRQNVSKVDVNEQNPEAVGFYKYMGFKVTKRSELDGMGLSFPILHMEL